MKKKQRSSLANNPKNWSIEAAKLVYTGTLIFLGIAVGVFNLFLQNVISFHLWELKKMMKN